MSESYQKRRLAICPDCSKGEVNRAAEKMRDGLDSVSEEEKAIIETWRSSHVHILNSWSTLLKNRIKENKILFAQRLKRLNTICDKLCRYKTMKFTTMQDIAGCRLIFENIDELNKYRSKLHGKNRFSHILVNEVKEGKKEKDYIKTPKDSGYRGKHDIYKYKSREVNSDSGKWDGLFVEIQYRTVYQHAWATAVEVADNIMRSRTKFSDGDESQQYFFKYASEIIARAHEGCTSCFPELSNAVLISSFKKIDEKLQLIDKLKVLDAIPLNDSKNDNHVILHLVYNKDALMEVKQEFYKSLTKANQKYFSMEKEFPNDDIVLVKGAKQNIRETFKNYFSDAQGFVEYVEDGIDKLSRNS